MPQQQQQQQPVFQPPPLPPPIQQLPTQYIYTNVGMYNPQQEQQDNLIIKFYTSKVKFNDKFIHEYANMMIDPISLQNIDFYHHLPVYIYIIFL